MDIRRSKAFLSSAIAAAAVKTTCGRRRPVLNPVPSASHSFRENCPTPALSPNIAVVKLPLAHARHDRTTGHPSAPRPPRRKYTFATHRQSLASVAAADVYRPLKMFSVFSAAHDDNTTRRDADYQHTRSPRARHTEDRKWTDGRVEHREEPSRALRGRKCNSDFGRHSWDAMTSDDDRRATYAARDRTK